MAVMSSGHASVSPLLLNLRALESEETDEKLSVAKAVAWQCGVTMLILDNEIMRPLFRCYETLPLLRTGKSCFCNESL